MKLARRTGERPEIALSSVANIAFQLMVLCLLTAMLSSRQGLDLAVPPWEVPPRCDDRGGLWVHVQADGSLLVSGELAMTLPDLLPYIEARLLLDRDGDGAPDNPKALVLIRTDPDAPYAAMIDVLDEIRQARGRIGIDIEVRSIVIPTWRDFAFERTRS